MAHLTANDFYCDDRTQLLRQTCLGLADASEVRLSASFDEISTADNRLMQGFQVLSDLGVAPGQHVGLPPEAYDSNASLMAEYVAGQWMLLPTQGSSNFLVDFIVLRSYINLTYRFLAAS
ncbi:hypothetical protein [Tengunoibacter tsumagoiensis]|uniref:Uncharacterized protein n=1 Tax=Tengunoibacter tsumagoiensis TaxID=2014871 RepID=A0A401ZZ70_9CHLR|nr:hypothetical protein [Tengunoibacter tsumagoiensis]GCE12123.1 hypothetical protein KTT_19820 [Tengunoibacter tsumagoiensis]